MKRILPILAAVILAACNPPEARQVEAQPTAKPAPEPAAPADDCTRVGALVDDLVKRKAAGLTERDALAELSARGDFRLGYVVDGVFGADPSTPGAMTRADILATCRKVNETGATY